MAPMQASLDLADWICVIQHACRSWQLPRHLRLLIKLSSMPRFGLTSKTCQVYL